MHCPVESDTSLWLWNIYWLPFCLLSQCLKVRNSHWITIDTILILKLNTRLPPERKTPTVFQPAGRWTLMHGLTRPTPAKTAGWTCKLHLTIRDNSSDNSLERTGIPSDRNSNNPKGCREIPFLYCLFHWNMHPNGALRAPPTLSWLKKSSFDLKPLVPQSMSLYEPTSWAAYSPAPWCCLAFKHLATIWHLRRATGIQGMPGHAMLGRHHDHHGTLWPCSKSFSRLQGWLHSLDGRRTMFDFQISDAFAGIDVRLWYYLGLLGRTYPAIDIFPGKAFKRTKSHRLRCLTICNGRRHGAFSCTSELSRFTISTNFLGLGQFISGTDHTPTESRASKTVIVRCSGTASILPFLQQVQLSSQQNLINN